MFEFRFKSLEKKRSREEVEYRQKSHFKTFLLQGKVNRRLNNIFGRLPKCIKNYTKLVSGQKKT